MRDFLKILSVNSDVAYKNFTAKLIPNIKAESIIGVRVPILRKIVKDEYEECSDFLKSLPHEYHEENMLHAFFINSEEDIDTLFLKLDEFLPYVDNWAVCDSLRPRAFAENKKPLMKKIKGWLKSEHTYTKRFALEMLMLHFLESDFSQEYLELAAAVDGDDYYLKMMVSWYFATALAYQYDEAIVFIEEKRLDPWIHNKAIQKAKESLRIAEEKKKYLKELKI